jgi:hypothetical protein
VPRTSLTHLRLVAFVIAASCAWAAPARGGCGSEHVVPLAMVEPAGDFQTGCSRAIAVDWTDPTQAILVAFPRCDEGACARNGRDPIECQFEFGFECPNQLWMLSRLPGRHAGPVERGLRARYDADTDTRDGLCHADYVGSGHRLLFVPVIDGLERDGSQQVESRGVFAAFFLRERPDAGRPLSLEFLYDVVIGGCPE